MKKLLPILFILFITHLRSYSQDTTKILFIGNSFTGANDLQAIVRDFFLFDKIPVVTKAYAPGGITVGDVAMGTDAHMYNPVVFDLIKSNDWDFLVLQDNQGRFALDSAVFPSVTKSKVIEGHIKIRDSFHHYHSCGKMIWFSGWGFQDEDTSMINQITTNYEVLNDSAKDVIAPIGYAWKKSIIDRPDINLWSPDGAHPDMTGSFLTAATIYGAIAQKDVTLNMFMYAIPPDRATFLKLMAQQTLTNPTIKRKSNLKGIVSAKIATDKTNLKGENGKKLYRWYFDEKLMLSSTDSVYKPAKSGKYKLWTLDNDGTWQKSCEELVTIKTTIPEFSGAGQVLRVFPNPASDVLTVKCPLSEVHAFDVYAVSGQHAIRVIRQAEETRIDIRNLPSGMYLIRALDAERKTIINTTKFVKQ